MSEPTPEPPADAPLVDDIDGRCVRISGYAVPLEITAGHVTEFLLVPYVGACIHVPPPQANQIEHVRLAVPIALSDHFDAVTVSGRISARTGTTSLAAVGYRMDTGEAVLLRC